MINYYVSIISHGHGEIIMNGGLSHLTSIPNVNFILRDNIGEEDLRIFCENNYIKYFKNDHPIGFGENNNINLLSLDLTENDFVVIMNPDVLIGRMEFEEFLRRLVVYPSSIMTIRLFRSEQYDILDNNLRQFPTLLGSILSFIGVKDLKYTEVIPEMSRDQNDRCEFGDWISASFMALNGSIYRDLNGFSKSYYMYMEDVDLCRRFSYRFYGSVMRFADLKGIHIGGSQNRKMFSKHFGWHLRSLLIYFLLAGK